MSAERVVVTRTEMQQLRTELVRSIDIVDAILRRPDPQPPATDAKGWPLLGEDGPYDPRD